jgi:ubiquinone/menaquinone biosynthesis C-methylase UbiE
MTNNKNILFDINFILNKISLSQREKIAELGCGNFGYFVFPAATMVGPLGKLYAVDILKTTLEDIKKRAMQDNLKQIETIWSNVEVFKGTKIANSSLDKVFLINILNQSDKKHDIIREAVRMLKNSAKLLVVEWKSIDSPIGPIQEKRIHKNTLKEIAPRMNLILEEEFEAGPYHYGLIFHKS